MIRQSHFQIGVGTLLVIFLIILPVLADKIDEPELSSRQVDRLRTLPHSIAGQTSLIIRRKHVEDVTFAGAGSKSQYGFALRDGLIHQGLWLRLRNRRGEKWANGTIEFTTPVNARRYNSVVVWLRSNIADQRIWLGLQDDDWAAPDQSQARSNIVPLDGLPKKEVIQLVIPYKAIFSERRLKYERLKRIRFEFGRNTVGNSKKARIEVFGIAFVKQERPLAYVKAVSEMVVARKAKAKPKTGRKVVKQELPPPPPPPVEMEVEEELEHVVVEVEEKPDLRKVRIVYSVPDPSLPKVYFSARGKNIPVFGSPQGEDEKIGTLKNGTKYLALQSARVAKERWFYLEYGHNKAGWVDERNLELSHTEDDVQTASSSSDSSSPSLQLKPVIDWLFLDFVRGFVSVLRNVFSWQPPSLSVSGGLLFLLGFPPLTVLLFVYFYRRQKTRVSQVKFDRLFHEVQMPVLHGNQEKEKAFWKEYALNRIGRAWISVNHADLDKRPEEEYRGEEFLLRQIRLAREAKVELIPSVCFVRTVFNYDTFLAHPELYLTKSIPKNETHYSDEELRLHHMGYFPAWIPPYWQKQHGLPQRILVAFGKLPGTVFTTDSVQYDLTSPDLRRMAIRLIKKLAKKTSAIRIEGASALMNSSLKLYWAGQIEDDQIKKEFWLDIIQKVKQEFPQFQFIADSAGTDPKALKELGFDYVENDRVRDVFANQIRMETAGHLKKTFAELDKRILYQSIFNITPIMEPSRPSQRGFSQGTLTAILLGLLPGFINFRGRITPDLKQILKVRSRWPALKSGEFALLESQTPSIFAFARWQGRSLILAIANFARAAVDTHIQLGPTLYGFDERRLYLFNDVLHGTVQMKNVHREKAQGPASAIWGQDLRETGLPLQMSGLSLKIISVNLTRSLEKKPEYQAQTQSFK